MINCPVCNIKYQDKVHFCENEECGWEFKYFLSNLSNDMLEKENKRLDIAVKNYQRIKNLARLIENKDKKIEQVHETLNRVNDLELKFKKALEDKDNEIARIRAENNTESILKLMGEVLQSTKTLELNLKQEKEKQIFTEAKKDEKPKSDFIARAGMVLVKKGSFMMGSNESNDEKPIHKVDFTYDFYIGKYQVTQKEYQEIMGNNPSKFKGNNLPVEQISWYDAIKFCNELSKKLGLSVAYKAGNGDLLDQNRNVTSDITKVKGIRLLTEAEWEYAARGGNQSDGYIYSGSNNIDEVAWYYENSGRKTHEVGTKKTNELGLYDMTGNVWEWCHDWYDENFYKTSSNTNAVNLKESSYRIVRGGSWYDCASYVRSANRCYDRPDNSSFLSLGFRFAKTF